VLLVSVAGTAYQSVASEYTLGF